MRGNEYYGRTFFLYLDSDPQGATIYLDDERKGYTPSTITFTYLHDPYGNHEDEQRQRIVTIKKAGYEPHVFSFSIQGNEYSQIKNPIVLKPILDETGSDTTEE